MQRQLPPRGSRAICLGRHSSELQNPKSADDQIREAIAYCERHGWIVVRTEKDEARTGRTTVGRSGFYNVMAAAEAGECDVVVVEDISRMARDAADMLMAARKLSELDVVICTLGGGVIGGLELAIRAQMAQEQSEETARRVKRGHRSAAKDGRAIGGVAYGYLVLDEPDEHGGKRGIDETKAKVVLRVFKDLAAGMSPHAVCSALNGEGVPAPSGKLWRPKVITGHPGLKHGIARNPLYVGKLVYGKTNSRLIASTGKIKVTAGPTSEQIIKDLPHLRIVPDDLWQEVQEILDERSAKLHNEKGERVPNRVRQPPYLFSGLIRCGCCGHGFNMVSHHLGCEGRRQNTGCTNRRRVSREELQEAVLTGLKERLLQPQILDLYLDEYRKEVEMAVAEQGDRSVTVESRLKEVDREIANTMDIVRAGAIRGHAAELLNEELDRLGAQKKQLQRETRRAPPPPPLSLETCAVIERLQALLDNLNEALTGPERDAARARDAIRSFVTRIEVVPLEVEGKPDGRGIGPVRITVHGSLTELLGHASADRMIQRRGSTLVSLNQSNVPFRYYVDITRKESETVGGVYADVAVFSRLLDDAEAPVARQEIVNALHGAGAGGDPTADELAALRLRADNAVTHLVRAGLIRSLMVWFGYKGWVWNDRDITDEEWISRGKQPRSEPPIGILRVSAPEAFVVVIGSDVAVLDSDDD